jgi:septum formation protein
MRLMLASQSPRRAELLRAAGFAFDTLTVDIDEARRPGESADAYVRRLATTKSASAWASLDDQAAVVVAADTAVVVDGDVLGKPTDDADAAAMLGRLSGRTHEVLTGVSVRTGERELVSVARTEVDFSRLSDEDVRWYVASGEGRDKAGGYAIQGLGSRFVERIVGSYSNVVGLPIATVSEMLRAAGFLASSG